MTFARYYQSRGINYIFYEVYVKRFCFRIQNNYENLILNHASFARSKDVIALLWKHCFYYSIEEHRQSMKSLVTSIDSGKLDPSQQRKAEEKLGVVASSFKAFLSKTTAFFSELLSNVIYRMDPTSTRIHLLITCLLLSLKFSWSAAWTPLWWRGRPLRMTFCSSLIAASYTSETRAGERACCH
jgi:hypothetical protein